MDANTSLPHVLLHQLCSIFLNLSCTGQNQVSASAHRVRESTETEVSESHSHSQTSIAQQTRSGYAPRRVLTPSPDGPADFELIRPGTGRPVRLPIILPLSSVFSPGRGPLSMDTLAHSWPRGLWKYAYSTETCPYVALVISSVHRMYCPHTNLTSG